MSEQLLHSNDSKSLWNYTLSPGWTDEEVEIFRLVLIKLGMGRWSDIIKGKYLPGKTQGQLNNQMQRMIGQQSVAEFQGLHIDPAQIWLENKSKIGFRKNGCLINHGDNPTKEDIRQKRAENKIKWSLSVEEYDNIVIPRLSQPNLTRIVRGHLTGKRALTQAKYDRIRTLERRKKYLEELLEYKKCGKGGDDVKDILSQGYLSIIKRKRNNVHNEENNEKVISTGENPKKATTRAEEGPKYKKEKVEIVQEDNNKRLMIDARCPDEPSCCEGKRLLIHPENSWSKFDVVEGEKNSLVHSRNRQNNDKKKRSKGSGVTTTKRKESDERNIKQNHPPSKSKKSIRKFKLRQRIESEWDDGVWYPGTIDKIHKDGSFDILYDDGGLEKNADEEIVRILKYPRHKFKKGERVEALWEAGVDWFPGTIVCENKNGSYHINYDDGDVEKNVRPELISSLKEIEKENDSSEVCDKGDTA